MVSISQERRDRERVEIRGRILDAARELFAREGYEAVTMRKVADRIGYSPTALYFHFADKETLVRRLVLEDFRSLAAHFNQLEAVADPMQRLRRLGEAYLDFAQRFPNHYRLMFMTPLPPEVDPVNHAEGLADRGIPERDAYAVLRKYAEEAMAAGCFRQEIQDVDFVAQVLWAGVHGVASLSICMKGEGQWIELRPPALLNSEVTGCILRGLARPGWKPRKSSSAAPRSRPAAPSQAAPKKPSRSRS